LKKKYEGKAPYSVRGILHIFGKRALVPKPRARAQECAYTNIG